MTLRLAFVAAMTATTAARADVTATYGAAGTDGKTVALRVEAASNGDMRIDVAGGRMTFIGRGGRVYLVVRLEGQPMVVALAQTAALAREKAAEHAADCSRAAQVGTPAKLVRRGTVTVHGRTGEAWYGAMPDGTSTAAPEIVLSHDPALAPVGRALAAQYRAGIGIAAACPAAQALAAPVQAVLDTGTPLVLGKAELVSIEQAPIDPKRFDLPAVPAFIQPAPAKPH